MPFSGKAKKAQMQQKRDRICTKKEASAGGGEGGDGPAMPRPTAAAAAAAADQPVQLEAQIKAVSGVDKAQRLMDVLPDNNVGGGGGKGRGGGSRGGAARPSAGRRSMRHPRAPGAAAGVQEAPQERCTRC